MRNEQQLRNDIRQIGVYKVAAASGITPQTIYRFLNEEVSPMVKTYSRICKAVEKIERDQRIGWRGRFFRF